ncbi:MAG: thermonuclease family protein [Deltaproteobacteria bacterium]
MSLTVLFHECIIAHGSFPGTLSYILFSSPRSGFRPMARRWKRGQPQGIEATKELKALILGELVQVYLTGDKTYGREVCIIYDQGMNINLEMVKRGYAWAYRRYLKTPYASEFIDAERQAREKKLGIWQDANPMPPWEFRRLSR